MHNIFNLDPGSYNQKDFFGILINSFSIRDHSTLADFQAWDMEFFFFRKRKEYKILMHLEQTINLAYLPKF